MTQPPPRTRPRRGSRAKSFVIGLVIGLICALVAYFVGQSKGKAGLAAADSSVRIAGEWLRAEQIDYDLALGEPKTLVAAARADLEARAGRVEAVRRYNLAVLRLLARTGLLADTAARSGPAGTLFEHLPGH